MALAAFPAGGPNRVDESPPVTKWKPWGPVSQAVRNLWLLVGPKLRIRLEQWPRVRHPAPEAEPDLVVPVELTTLLAAPFVVGLRQR
eukprot:6105594-Amphidinium_carterae.1